MTRRLVYDVEKLAELPVGAVVQAHRPLAYGDEPAVAILVRQPDGWYGAWGWDVPLQPGLVVPCTVISIESVRGGPHPTEPIPTGDDERPEWKPQADPTRYQPGSAHP